MFQASNHLGIMGSMSPLGRASMACREGVGWCMRTVPTFVTESGIVTLVSDVHSRNAACERDRAHVK